jgi:HAD superfamily hydrolase (TIGR01484 family)
MPKKLIIFDLDGTLAESKAAIDAQMASLLNTLLTKTKVAIISGGSWLQFESQLLSNLPSNENFNNLSLLPTCGTKFYQFRSNWNLLYSEELSQTEKDKIIKAIMVGIHFTGYKAKQTWGEVIEDRGSQITFSGLGQFAPITEKVKWDPDFTKRKALMEAFDREIPEFSIRMGGNTSIDITKPGINKAYGIHKLKDLPGIPLEEMIFVGDALFEGGNDFPVTEAGVVSIEVKNTNETKLVAETMIAFLG